MSTHFFLTVYVAVALGAASALSSSERKTCFNQLSTCVRDEGVACLDPSAAGSKDCCSVVDEAINCFMSFEDQCAGLEVFDEGKAAFEEAKRQCQSGPIEISASEVGNLVPGVSFPSDLELSEACAQGLRMCKKDVPLDACSGPPSDECCAQGRDRSNCLFNVVNLCSKEVMDVWNNMVREMVADYVEKNCEVPTPTLAPGQTPGPTPGPTAPPSTSAPQPTATPVPTEEPTSSEETPTGEPSEDGSSSPESPPTNIDPVSPGENISEECANALNSCIADASIESTCDDDDEDACCDAATEALDCVEGLLGDDEVCEGLDDDLSTLLDQARSARDDACDSGNVCFPADARVKTPKGDVSMEKLNLGDKVLSADGTYSEVHFFSHRVAQKSYRFVQISLADGGILEMTGGHYLPVNGALSPARSVRAGDHVEKADGALVPVVGVSVAMKRGLYNPHTLSGTVVVNGIRTSVYTTAVHPALGHAILSPLRGFYRLGFCVPSWLDEDAPLLANLLPRGRSQFI